MPNFAKDVLGAGKLSKEGNDALSEYFERLVFKRCYGISADREMRAALIKYQKKHQRELSWAQIRRAYPKIKLVGSKIVATLSIWDHIFRWLVSSLAVYAGAYSLLTIAIATFNVPKLNPYQYFALTVVALVLLAVAVLFSTMNWAYHNTKTIIKLSGQPD